MYILLDDRLSYSFPCRFQFKIIALPIHTRSVINQILAAVAKGLGTLREETHVAHTIAPAVQDPKAGNHSILYSDHTTDDTFQELEQPQNARKIENSGEQGITNEQANSGNLLSETNMAIKDKARHDRVMQEILRMEEAVLHEV